MKHFVLPPRRDEAEESGDESASAGPEDGFWQLQILALSGERLGDVKAELDWTVDALKSAVEEATGVPVCEQRLVAGIRDLFDAQVEIKSVLGKGVTSLTLIRRDPAHAKWLEFVEDGWKNQLCRAPQEVKADREIVLAAVREDGDAFRFAAPELQADQEIVVQAVQLSRCALQHASLELRRNPGLRALAGVVISI
uniref:Ubiquitin-like domain-containing protein n=1 Tax=Alexandrium catenella TaxID=2925 RepID=A0A7S1Q1F3_ALECA